MLNEDRSKEFKHYDTRDSQFTLRKMRDHVARCICGFLNSQQGGVVLIGITEEGKLTPDTRNSQDHVVYVDF